MEFLKQQRYPGRFIIFGKEGDTFVAIYGATGRSDASLNRRYEQRGSDVVAIQLEEGGDPELLTYSAVRAFGDALVVANGRQIEKVRTNLENDLAEEMYEPDAYNTPRITGFYRESQEGSFGALHIIRATKEGVERKGWDVPLVSGKGSYIATYNGDDVRPVPSFSGDPIDVRLDFGSAENAAQSVFDILAPKAGEKDYRVGVVACYKKHGIPADVAIVNAK